MTQLTLSERAGALEEEMGEPGFWDDQERAARRQRRARARDAASSTMFRELERDVDDLEPLAELAEEDPEIAAELEEQVRGVQERLDALEEQRLFAGRYDAGDAFVTVNAGAGGTDAQDWAEMVLRMEMRWAEKRGFAVELLEVSPGEEAGIKSATFLVKGENAYGLYGSEKGVHRLVRLSPFDAAHRRQTSFAGRRGLAGRRRHRRASRSTRTTSRSTPTAPAAPAGSTSTRPTRRCGSRTSRRGSSSSARTSARSPRTRPRR